VNHDIIVFTSEMMEQEEIEGLEIIVHPAKLLVEIDNLGLHQMIDDLNPSQRKYPALTSYKHMMWMDSDAFCTRTWKQDPFAAMERHDLALVGLKTFVIVICFGSEILRRLTKEMSVVCDQYSYLITFHKVLRSGTNS